MVVILKQKASEQDVERLIKQIEAKGVTISPVQGKEIKIL